MFALLLMTAAWSQTCDHVTAADIVAVQPPAVIVLGVRPGTQPDLWRAGRMAKRLSRTSPITLAIDAVPAEQQSVLDRYAEGAVLPGDLPDLLDWEATNGFDWAPHRPLVTAATWAARVVAIGHEWSRRPADAILPLPTSYMFVLGEAFGDAPVPVAWEPRLVEMMAWRDHRMTATALAGWDGRGFLVIVADRFHVEGGKGVSYQASRMTDHPVHAFLVGDAGAHCWPEDRIWR
ncbi:MAG: hypothetical protein ACI8PZ_001452 [Myxococcota bacterium]|jgi:hypothetical protein